MYILSIAVYTLEYCSKYSEYCSVYSEYCSIVVVQGPRRGGTRRDMSGGWGGFPSEHRRPFCEVIYTTFDESDSLVDLPSSYQTNRCLSLIHSFTLLTLPPAHKHTGA